MQSRLDPYSLTGASLGERYSVGSFVGFGRFSVVYRGMEVATERRVALRFLKTRGTLTSSERTVLVERLRALAQPVIEVAEHAPALADLLEVTALATSEGRWMPALVQAWAPGQTLESLMAHERQRGETRRSIGRAVELLSPVADAVQYAHARGLVHGSLSPRTVFVHERTNLAVRDFGLCRVLDIVQAEGRALSEPTTPMYTFAAAYGAPEQFSEGLEVGPPTDVFALALLVVELVTGLPPLGDGDDEQLAKAAADPVYRPTSRGRASSVTLGPYVESVLERALAVRPQDRYASVTSFWDALRVASRLMLRTSPSSILPPPLPAGATGPATRPSIPPPQFFAPAAPMADENDVESETNPLFGGLLARSVAPTSMDTPPAAADRAAEARSIALGRRVAAVAAAFALGVGGAAIARSATPHHRTFATTPLPADVLAAVAAIKLPPRPPPAPPCPSGMVRVPGATVSLPGKPPREVTVAPYCISALEVTVDQFASCTDTTCKRAVTSSTTNAWPGISWWEHKTLDPQCNARDPKASAMRPMNCIDEKTAAAYCEARGARLPTEAEWALAAKSAGAGVDGTRWEWTSDGARGGGAQPPARWPGTNVASVRSHTLGFRCAEGSR